VKFGSIFSAILAQETQIYRPKDVGRRKVSFRRASAAFCRSPSWIKAFETCGVQEAVFGSPTSLADYASNRIGDQHGLSLF